MIFLLLEKFALAASGCMKTLLAFTWVPLKMKLNGSEKNIKYKIKKNKNIILSTEKRETRNERRDLTASLRVLIND